MIQQRAGGYLITLTCPDVDEVLLCCDCLGWFPMQRVDASNWELELSLRPGEHHLRYYVRCGTSS